MTQKRRTFRRHFIRYPPSLQDSHTSYNASHTSKASQTYQISQTIFLILVSHRLPSVVSDQSRLCCQFFSISCSTNTYQLEASRRVTKVASTLVTPTWGAEPLSQLLTSETSAKRSGIILHPRQVPRITLKATSSTSQHVHFPSLLPWQIQENLCNLKHLLENTCHKFSRTPTSHN